MKKAITLLVGAVVAQGFAANAMAEGPIDGKVYGKLNTAVIMEDDSTTEDVSLGNYSSRLGFKGKTELSDGLYAVYKLEYGVDPDEKAEDEGNHQIFKQRNSYVGLSHKSYGTIIAGTHDTPLKKVQGNIDMFDRLPNGDFKNVIVGQERINDLVHYTSPKMAGFSVKAATQVQEAGDPDDASSVSVTYDKGAIFAGIGIDDKVKGYDTTRSAFQFKGDGFTAGAVYNTSEKSDGSSKSKDGMIISGSYKIDAFNLKAQFGAGDEKGEGTEILALGADYKFSKQTKLFGYGSTHEKDDGTDITTLGLGMEHNF